MQLYSLRLAARPRPKLRKIAAGLAVLTGSAGPALAHATDQPFVQLLPTGIYMTAGIASVLATLLLTGLPRIGALLGRWEGKSLDLAVQGWIKQTASLLSLVSLLVLLAAGHIGSTDPLANPLPLTIWVFWWIVLVLAQVLIGNLWSGLNPWTGLIGLMRPLLPEQPPQRLPQKLGSFPAIVLFLAFALFMLADPAPADPRRLSWIIGIYLLFTYAGMIVFGQQRWLAQCEFITVLMRMLALLAPLGRRDGTVCAGAPGWQIVSGRPELSLAVLAIVMLATGSFESLYATFLWLSLIGLNPLEFPGRSMIFVPTALGLAGAILLSLILFALLVRIGVTLIGEGMRFREAFCRQASCLLPIIAGYHLAHYLTSLLVDGQYLLAALNDPFSTGANLLGAAHAHVTTGFLHTQDKVRLIWLTQAGAVVAAHIMAILVSHAVALNMFGNERKAMISQTPISIFMVFYTFFGLWLLASPRGM